VLIRDNGKQGQIDHRLLTNNNLSNLLASLR